MSEMSETHKEDKGRLQPLKARLKLGLSAKLLIMTALFIMVAEVLIFVPSVANFRKNWLEDRLASAQIASLVVEAAPDQKISDKLMYMLLDAARVKGVATRNNEIRQMILSKDMPPVVDRRFDLRDPAMYGLIMDAMETLFVGRDRNIRILGNIKGQPGGFLEVILAEKPLRDAMLTFALNILKLSLIISAVTATAVYFLLIWIFVRPMRHITYNMVRFRQDPADGARIIKPSSRRDEIGIAEIELARMQEDLTQMLQQKSHLEALGLAVSKISHDLRNMLSSAHLISDRLSGVEDPTVKRFAPKLIASLDRAINFCTQTLKYGRVQEDPPKRKRLYVQPLINEVYDVLSPFFERGVSCVVNVEPDLEIDADREQLFRILFNLVRNSCQVLEVSKIEDLEVRTTAWREGSVVTIEVKDNGPGLPERAKEHLFDAFKGSVRSGGTGLGLAIAQELANAHGGTIRLIDTPDGATFHVTIPDRVTALPQSDRFPQAAS
jgi:signal transduction histidine kinase